MCVLCTTAILKNITVKKAGNTLAGGRAGNIWRSAHCATWVGRIAFEKKNWSNSVVQSQTRQRKFFENFIKAQVLRASARKFSKSLQTFIESYDLYRMKVSVCSVRRFGWPKKLNKCDKSTRVYRYVRLYSSVSRLWLFRIWDRSQRPFVGGWWYCP